MDFMKKFFNRKRTIFSIVIVAVVAILIGTLAVKPRVERWMVEKEFLENVQKMEEEEEQGKSPRPRLSYNLYEEKIPLCEMDANKLGQMANMAFAAIGYEQPDDAYLIALPADLHYYHSPDDSQEPALTLQKGEVVVLYGNKIGRIGDVYGYGCTCYPDYKAGWRYGKVFLKNTEKYSDNLDTFYSDAENQPSYYVKTADLEAIAMAYYEKNYHDMTNFFYTHSSKEEYAHKTIREIDNILFRYGFFCSPDLP